MNFRDFYQKFPYLDMEELIINYSIFEGYPFLDEIELNSAVQESIQKYIINKYEALKEFYRYSNDFEIQKDFEKILSRLAKGDRKNYTVYKKENISQIKGREVYKRLFSENIIKKEYSREKPIRDGKKPIKKHLRRYRIQDKILFCNNFTRFWFWFDKPLDINHIVKHLEKFVSLEFENLSNELLEKIYKNENILSSGGYWDKDIEIDLLIETGSLKIAGEAKWKNRKTCKNILTSLINKCEKSGLGIDRYALFSKSGYSKELYSKKYANISLYELKDFEVLLK